MPVFYTPNGVNTDFYRPRGETHPSAQPETFRREERNGFQAKFRAPLSSISSLVRNLSEFGAGGRAGRGEVRVGWAGSLSNQGPEQRGFHDLIAPAVRSVGRPDWSWRREKRWRSPVEMLEFYRSIDIYLCASRSEGTPNPCLEAAACGVPLVTTRVGNMPELVRHGVNGLFVERNVADVAAKLTRCATTVPCGPN